MIIKKFVSKTVLFLLLGSLCPAFAQLNGEYTPDLARVEIPVFDGVTLEETISATSFGLTMVQGLTSSKLSAMDGYISGSEFYANDELVVNFDGDMTFSATATKSGSIVRLAGAKTTIVKGSVTGDGVFTDDSGSYSVTLTGVIGTFAFKTLSVDIESGQIAGLISSGALKVSGYLDEDPTQKGTVTAKYEPEDFGPFDFPADNIVTPEIVLFLTTTKNKITGSASGTFGDYDEVGFKVTGTRNAKTGISALTLTSTSVKGISAKLNLDGNADLNGTKNSMKVLGYTLTY
ncbi:MAG: hypothetical protein EBT07_11110 [Actinobacteria bacterium]|nr:hypothetical protein [Actinomycetota bacterium]